MKKLLLCLLILCCAGAAASGEALPDGLYSIGVQSSAKMFRVVDCLLQVQDGSMIATLTMSGTGYGYLYPGTPAEADAADRSTWIPSREDFDGAYCFDVPIAALDTPIDVAAWSKRYEKWYERQLVFHSASLSPAVLTAPDGVWQGTVESDLQDLQGMPCILSVKDGEMMAEIGGEPVLLPSLDLKIPHGDGWIYVDDASLAPHAVAADDGVYSADAKTDSALLQFSSCILTIENGQMTARLTAKKNSFDYLYPGTAAQARLNEAAWIPAETDENGCYTYCFPLESLDNALPVATYSAKKNMWYDRTLTVETASLTSLE